MYFICWIYCGKSRNESVGWMHHERRERKSTALFRRISYKWNFPQMLSSSVVFCSESGDRLVRLEHVEDDGDVGVLPPQFRELVLGSNW